MIINWYKFNPEAKLPTKRAEDAGFDIYTIDNKLVICTSNGLNITEDYSKFTMITKSINTYNPTSEELLNSFICNKIIRKDSNKYTVLHGIGLTEGITI